MQHNKQKMFNIPPITAMILALMLGGYVILYVTPLIFSMREYAWIIMNFGFVPAPWVGRGDFTIWTIFSPITHLFLHGGFMHLCLNGFMMMAFGGAVEKMMGRRRFIQLIVISALGGLVAQSLLNLGSTIPMIGISAVVNGLFAAILLLMFMTGDAAMRRGFVPFVVLWVVITIGFGFIAVPGFEDTGVVAWAAHLGGFFAGLAAVWYHIKSRGA